MQIVPLRTRLTIVHPDLGRAIVTNWWIVEQTSNAHIVAICRDITTKLVGPGLFSDAWRRLLPRGAFLTRFQVGPAQGGFYVDHRLGGRSFEGARLLLLFPGLQKTWINSRILWIADFKRSGYTQVPLIWKKDFTNDSIWEPYFVLLEQTAEKFMQDFVTAAGDLFYLVVRSKTFLYLRPFTYRVDRLTSRQLHRRTRE